MHVSIFKEWLCDLWTRMRHASSQMHPWQPGECAEQSKQPLWTVCECEYERERERDCIYETTMIRRDLSDM